MAHGGEIWSWNENTPKHNHGPAMGRKERKPLGGGGATGSLIIWAIFGSGSKIPGTEKTLLVEGQIDPTATCGPPLGFSFWPTSPFPFTKTGFLGPQYVWLASTLHERRISMRLLRICRLSAAL